MPPHGPDSDSVPWYQGGLAFECTGCGNCCSGPGSGFVWVDDDEVRNMASQLAIDDLDLFERRFVRKVGLRRSLVEYADGDCIFLEPETKRCLVYAARPRQCRTWPFWTTTVESPQSWARTARSCPGCNQGRLYQLCEIQNILTKDAEASR